MDSDGLDDELGLYDELLITEVNEKVALDHQKKSRFDTIERENVQLKERITECETIKSSIEKQNASLKRNISVLYQTAKLEIERKDQLLRELQSRYDALVFRRTRGKEHVQNATVASFSAVEEVHASPTIPKEANDGFSITPTETSATTMGTRTVTTSHKATVDTSKLNMCNDESLAGHSSCTKDGLLTNVSPKKTTMVKKCSPDRHMSSEVLTSSKRANNEISNNKAFNDTLSSSRTFIDGRSSSRTYNGETISSKPFIDSSSSKTSNDKKSNSITFSGRRSSNEGTRSSRTFNAGTSSSRVSKVRSSDKNYGDRSRTSSERRVTSQDKHRQYPSSNSPKTSLFRESLKNECRRDSVQGNSVYCGDGSGATAEVNVGGHQRETKVDQEDVHRVLSQVGRLSRKRKTEDKPISPHSKRTHRSLQNTEKDGPNCNSVNKITLPTNVLNCFNRFEGVDHVLREKSAGANKSPVVTAQPSFSSEKSAGANKSPVVTAQPSFSSEKSAGANKSPVVTAQPSFSSAGTNANDLLKLLISPNVPDQTTSIMKQTTHIPPAVLQLVANNDWDQKLINFISSDLENVIEKCTKLDTGSSVSVREERCILKTPSPCSEMFVGNNDPISKQGYEFQSNQQAVNTEVSPMTSALDSTFENPSRDDSKRPKSSSGSPQEQPSTTRQGSRQQLRARKDQKNWRSDHMPERSSTRRSNRSTDVQKSACSSTTFIVVANDNGTSQTSLPPSVNPDVMREVIEQKRTRGDTNLPDDLLSDEEKVDSTTDISVDNANFDDPSDQSDEKTEQSLNTSDDPLCGASGLDCTSDKYPIKNNEGATCPKVESPSHAEKMPMHIDVSTRNGESFAKMFDKFHSHHSSRASVQRDREVRDAKEQSKRERNRNPVGTLNQGITRFEEDGRSNTEKAPAPDVGTRNGKRFLKLVDKYRNRRSLCATSAQKGSESCYRKERCEQNKSPVHQLAAKQGGKSLPMAAADHHYYDGRQAPPNRRDERVDSVTLKSETEVHLTARDEVKPAVDLKQQVVTVLEASELPGSLVNFDVAADLLVPAINTLTFENEINKSMNRHEISNRRSDGELTHLKRLISTDKSGPGNKNVASTSNAVAPLLLHNESISRPSRSKLSDKRLNAEHMDLLIDQQNPPEKNMPSVSTPIVASSNCSCITSRQESIDEGPNILQHVDPPTGEPSSLNKKINKPNADSPNPSTASLVDAREGRSPSSQSEKRSNHQENVISCNERRHCHSTRSSDASYDRLTKSNVSHRDRLRNNQSVSSRSRDRSENRGAGRCDAERRPSHIKTCDVFSGHSSLASQIVASSNDSSITSRQESIDEGPNILRHVDPLTDEPGSLNKKINKPNSDLPNPSTASLVDAREGRSPSSQSERRSNHQENVISCNVRRHCHSTRSSDASYDRLRNNQSVSSRSRDRSENRGASRCNAERRPSHIKTCDVSSGHSSKRETHLDDRSSRDRPINNQVSRHSKEERSNHNNRGREISKTGHGSPRENHSNCRRTRDRSHDGQSAGHSIEGPGNRDGHLSKTPKVDTLLMDRHKKSDAEAKALSRTPLRRKRSFSRDSQNRKECDDKRHPEKEVSSTKLVDDAAQYQKNSGTESLLVANLKEAKKGHQDRLRNEGHQKLIKNLVLTNVGTDRKNLLNVKAVSGRITQLAELGLKEFTCEHHSDGEKKSKGKSVEGVAQPKVHNGDQKNYKRCERIGSIPPNCVTDDEAVGTLTIEDLEDGEILSDGE